MTKTAMMQLRDKLEKQIERLTEPHLMDIKKVLQSLITDIDNTMLEVEREQIRDAYDNGFELDYIDGLEYYNKTFTQNKNG